MPIKSMLRLFWIGNGFISLLLILALFLIFSHAESTNKPDMNIQLKGERKKEEKRPYHYYEDIWRVEVNIKAPPVVAVAGPPSDWHQQLISRNVKVEQILSHGFALVTINNQNRLIEALTAKNRTDRSKPWEANIGGHRVIIKEIVLGKGILFLFEQSKKEVWLEHKQDIPKENKSSSSSSQNQMNAPGQWSITPEEGTELLKNSDKYIEEMAPEVEYDENRNPIGIKLRRIPANSKAYNFGLRENDVINDINGSPMNSLNPDALRQIVERHRKDNGIVVRIQRNNQTITLSFDIRR